MMTFPIEGYVQRRGAWRDRTLVSQFLKRTYQELYPDQCFDHLNRTVEQYFSLETPTWWIALQTDPSTPIAGLWMGNTVDQISGDRHAYIFMLFVEPAHRRRGIGSALMQTAETWAAHRGDRQIGLQVFTENRAAINLYETLGYRPQAIWMIKPISQC